MSLILFADESGMDTFRMLDSNDCRPAAAVVVDPKRLGARQHAESHFSSDTVLDHPTREDRARFESEITRLQPSLGLIVSYSRILWRELINLFPNGVVNIHGAPLPQYRGANVLQWVLINGEQETGVTIHYVDAGVDTGPIIEVVAVPINDEDTAFSLRAKLQATAIDLLRKWVPKLVVSRVPSQPQDETKARVWPRRKPQDGKIDWNWSDVRIRNLTRALVPPWPPAFYEDRSGNMITIDHVLSVDEVRAIRNELSK